MYVKSIVIYPKLMQCYVSYSATTVTKLKHRSANFFHKELDIKYFRLFRPHRIPITRDSAKAAIGNV